MGEVYRGHDPRLDRSVAIKVLAGASPLIRTDLPRFASSATDSKK
jgi:serine/threonine protein kinase